MSRPVNHPLVLSPVNARTSIEAGRVVLSQPRMKVAITGAGRTLRDLPWDDSEWEIWGLNNFWNALRDSEGRLRADRWFEIHPPTTDIQDPHDMEWLRTCPVPIYTTQAFPVNPNAVVFPVNRLAKKYRDYFSCTFAYQIALAMDEGFREIALHGLELALGTQREATVERACLNWWLGYAEGQGIRITIPDSDFVLSHFARYGFDYWNEAKAVEQYCGTLVHRKIAE